MIIQKYCTQCQTLLNLSGEYPKCPVCKITYYKNSKPTAGILPVKDGQVLLAKRAIDPFKGSYDIIGGFLEYGEHPHDGARREAKEETGLDIEPQEILGIYMDEYGASGDSTLNIHYIGKIKCGQISPQDDIASLEWVSIMSVPLNEGFQNTRSALKDLQVWYSKQLQIRPS